MKIVLFLIVGLVFFGAMYSLYLLFGVYRSGKHLRRFYSEFAEEDHKRWVDKFLKTMVLIVVLVESTTWLGYGFSRGFNLSDSLSGLIHIAADIIFAVSLFVMRYIWTGTKSPRRHRFFFKLVYVSYAVLAPTGVWLMVKLLNS